MDEDLKLTAAELADLTEEERAGYLAMEGEPDAGTADDAGAKELLKADAEAEAADAGAGEQDDPTASPKADTGTEEQAAAATEPEELPHHQVPLIKADAPEDAQVQLDAIKARKAEMVQKFDDGDMSAKEFQAGVDALADEADAIKQSLFKTRISQEMAQQQAEQRWVDDVRDFATAHPEVRKSELLWGAFDVAVRKITSDSANAKLSNSKQLEMAHKLFAEQIGIATTTAVPKSDPKPERKVPPTLAKVPAADISETDSGEFAALERLAAANPDAYEAALKKLSPEKLDQYERGLR
ncbi:hypothetical protein V5F77_04345 [Xanthobacter sp. DSM 24535]|uniref:hypothetical protein n=1 Tax=Roseixanthobacter psychrophilus TaxID=3119917 RepID=UPI0037271C1F